MSTLMSFRPVNTAGECRSCRNAIRVDHHGRWVHARGGRSCCSSLVARSPFAEPALFSIVEPGR